MPEGAPGATTTQRRGIAGIELADVFDRSRRPMLVVDDERRYVDANPAALRLLGTTREQLLGLRIDDLTAPEERAGVPEAFARFLAGGTLASVIVLLRADGERVRVDYSALAHIAPGRHLSIFVPLRTVPVAAPDPDGPDPLSGREREVLRMVAEGADGPQIAEALVLSPATVRTHIGNATRKLGARSRAQAVAIAVRRGFV